jgi:aminoglycoside phosphotransferase (APT) family kinase protein
LLPEEVLKFLRNARLAGPVETPAATALSGGVASDIWRVELANGPVCVKRALPRLRVAQVWEAPVERNSYEYEWFRTAAQAAPEAVPEVIALGEGAFAMQYLEPARYPVWKSLLREGRADTGFAAQVGSRLAAIHGATAHRDDVAKKFPTDQIFRAIRLEPYLVASATRHPDLSSHLSFLVERTAATKLALVHGDVSPKNILAGPDGPVFLDAECAWYGDPAFDLAFCLNHLLLKCVWVPSQTRDFLSTFDALALAYLKGISWEESEALENRAATLLPALLLARVDGKSPVEYITSEREKHSVREVARSLLLGETATLSEIRSTWQRSLQ